MVTAVDASGPALRAALTAEPGVVSPNVREAEEIVGHEFGDEDDMAAAARTLTQMGAETALIHHEDGCVAHVRSGEGKRGHTFAGPPAAPRRRGLDRRLRRRLPGRVPLRALRPPAAEAALSLAVACGAANTQRFGAGVFDPSDVEALCAASRSSAWTEPPAGRLRQGRPAGARR